MLAGLNKKRKKQKELMVMNISVVVSVSEDSRGYGRINGYEEKIK